MSDAPAAYIDQRVKALVGIEMPIARLAGKWKLSQNRSERDHAGVVDGLLREGSESASAMAALVKGALDRR